MEQEYYTPHEIAKRFRVDDTTVRRWIRTGALEAETIRQGNRNRHRIRKATIETLETPLPPLGLTR
jgi:excisionase family DNA binding protein